MIKEINSGGYIISKSMNVNLDIIELRTDGDEIDEYYGVGLTSKFLIRIRDRFGIRSEHECCNYISMQNTVSAMLRN